MKNTFGDHVSLTIFGESHSSSIGVVIDGLSPGIPVDEEYISMLLSLRRPAGDLSTQRREKDEFRIESGVFGGYTTGTPVCILIPNADTKSKDYDSFRGKARPGHADYTAHIKYGGFEDYRGGGHFSGRITAGLVAAAGIIIPELKRKGIVIGTHIARCAKIDDKPFSNYESDILKLSESSFPVLDEEIGIKMQNAIRECREAKDSVGGIIETVIAGLPAGLGEPFFDSVESRISHVLFSIPAIKGVEFGAGFEIADMCGSEANDEFYMENGIVRTKTNNNGGINGGITNGMPVVFRCAVKPTPSISLDQNTVDFIKQEDTDITVGGRHDPCIVHRACVVASAAASLAVFDLIVGRFSTSYFGNGDAKK